MEAVENQNVDAGEWVPFALTLVEYPKGDLLGKVLAASSLLPFVYATVHMSFFVIVRDWHTFFFGVGAILNHIINYFLKISIKELRPMPTYRSEGTHFNVYGMPSTHSQFMTFYAFYFYLFVLFRLSHGGYIGETVAKGTWLTLNTLAAVVVIYSRIYLMYHTVEQIFYGSLIGIFLAYVWFWLVQNVFAPRFHWLSTVRGVEAVGICDLTNIPNVAKFMTFSFRNEAKRRLGKQKQ